MKTIRTLLIGLLFFTVSASGFTQNKFLLYTFMVNIAPDQFNIPLLGFVNIADGSHKSAHVGFINWNQNDFYGPQVSFINTIGGNLKGVQVGFINTTCRETDGIQTSFINSTIRILRGVQAGFINTTCRETEGLQVGFVNTTVGTLKGAEVGFVNTALKGTTGGQIGFVNITKSLKGLQLGFINYADTIQGGFPLGFLSIVRKGGYEAFELSCNEMYPVNLSYKIGIKQLYSSFNISYFDKLNKPFALGIGLGSILPVNTHFYVNPELTYLNTALFTSESIYNLSVNVGYAITPELQVIAGPSLSWNNNSWSTDPLNTPFYYLYNKTLDSHNSLALGLRVGLRYSFGDVK